MTDVLTKIKEMIPGTAAYNDLLASQRLAFEVMDRWSSGELVYSQLKERLENNRDFYLGKNYRQFNSSTTEGELRIVTNIGATVVDLIVYLLSNSAPTVQIKPKTSDRADQIEASVAEDLVARSFKLANFKKKLRDTCWLLPIGGFAWWYPFWNEEKEFGKKKNRFDFSLLNPFTTRVFFQDTDYEKVYCFITSKRMTPSVIYELYDGFEARPDSQNPYLPQEIKEDDFASERTTVFKQYDGKKCITIIDGRVAKIEDHQLDFPPFVGINNKYIVNEAHGYDDIFRMLPVAQELNMLISAASELARDLAYPPLLEYNGALGNKRLPKMRGQKIPVRKTDKGESLEYLISTAQYEPLLKQIQLLLDLFHFVSLMPKAAAGVFDSSVTSGFQARIAMQPATLSTENKRIDIDAAVIRLAKIALYLIEKNDPKALEIDDNNKLTELWDLDMDVRWPDNLPIDIAREIQNLILGVQNSLTSVTQAVDKYNVLMGMGSSEETISYLKSEADNPEINPDRALKLAQMKQTLAQIQQATGGISSMLNVGVSPQDVLPGGNDTNAVRAQGSSMPEEQQNSPDTAREAVPMESTGGQTLTP